MDKAVQYQIYQDWIFPDENLDYYAENISFSKGYSGRIPGPPKEFFINRLKGFASEPAPDELTSYNILPVLGDKRIGWGHLSWSNPTDASDEIPPGELFVWIHPDYRKQGIGTETCKQLLKLIPDHVTSLMVPAPLEEGAEFIKDVFQGEVTDTSPRKLLDLTNLNKDEVKSAAEEHLKSLEADGYETYLVTEETLDELLSLTEFIELQEACKGNELSPQETEDKVLDFVATMKRFRGWQSTYWILLLKHVESGKFVGYSHSILNAEGNKGTILDLVSGILQDHSSESNFLAIRYDLLDMILDQTPATHWLSVENENIPELDAANQKIGISFFTNHYTGKIVKADWEKFINE